MCNLDKFRKFGPGVYLMFKLFKHLIILMGIATLLALPQFIILMASPYYSDNNGAVRLNLMRLTLASLQPQHFVFYAGMDLLVTSFFFIGLIFWS